MVNKSNEAVTSTGYSVGGQVAQVGYVPIGISHGSNIEQVYSKTTGEAISSTVSSSASANIAYSPFGLFLTGEKKTMNSGGFNAGVGIEAICKHGAKISI